jgi:hypothetical protein
LFLKFVDSIDFTCFLQRNQELGVQSSYQPEMVQYSNVPVVIESKNALQEAQRLAAEIEVNCNLLFF